MIKDIAAEFRTELGSRGCNRLRRTGKIPAVLYSGGQAAESIAVNETEMLKIIHSGVRIVNLALPSRQAQALIKDLQFDSLGEVVQHVDFNELKAGQKIRVDVVVVTKGVPKGHLDGGQLNHPLHKITVECLPTAIPDRIVVDVESLGLNDAIHVKELKLPEGVVILTDAEAVVVSCAEPRKEVEATVEGALLEPEVIGAKKEDGEAEGAAPAAAGEKKAASAAGGEKKAAEPKKEAKK